jgi:hypothetical protein
VQAAAVRLPASVTTGRGRPREEEGSRGGGFCSGKK